MTTLGQNIIFQIYNADGTQFDGLVLHKSTSDSVVMSLGDKITGDVYYAGDISLTMQEYIVVKNNPSDDNEEGVKYILVNPPTKVKEGTAAENSQLKGMTKYTFVFYHPMCMLSNFPFTDVAVTNDQRQYLSESKVFSWIGYPDDFIAKLNKNLVGTEWIVEKSTNFPLDADEQLSEVIPFDNATIADALKTGYDTWGVPYVTGQVLPTETAYASGKRFKVIFGLPFDEIYEDAAHEQAQVPFVFHYGQGLGLKNNSRTPRNNKIITRIAGYGSEKNIPYGYPQIIWYGDQRWDYTEYEGSVINYDSEGKVTNTPKSTAYPIYKGIVGGTYVKLIKHPFTRKTLMPKVYTETLFNKVSPYAEREIIPTPDYTITLTDELARIDNVISEVSGSFKAIMQTLRAALVEVATHTSHYTVRFNTENGDGAVFMDDKLLMNGYAMEAGGGREFEFEEVYNDTHIQPILPNQNYNPNLRLIDFYDAIPSEEYQYPNPIVPSAPSYESHQFEDIKPELDADRNLGIISAIPLNADLTPADDWDDTMDDDGNYLQSYFQITLPQLSFDLYACASITEEMYINMRGGACIGCTFPVQVDWDDYKSNFFDNDGNFIPYGNQRNFEKYPDSSQQQISIIVQKDNNTFGTLMPNVYQNPAEGDTFVVLGISLPLSYIKDAEERLENESKAYMLENNIHYFDYPLKFDEYFLATHQHILSKLKTNSIVRFDYNGEENELYVKQLTIKYGESSLPKYDITLTDNIEIVLNQIGQAVDGVEKLGSLVNALRREINEGSVGDISKKLSRVSDDIAQGKIRFAKGIEIGSQFISGILGSGGCFRKEADGTTYLETDKMYVRMKAYFDTVEIREYKYTGGNRIASVAGNKAVRVEWIKIVDGQETILNQETASASTADFFRCYFRASDGEDTVRNNFVVGDMVYCHVTSIAGSSDNPEQKGLNQKHYWRLCIGRNVEGTLTDDGEAWIDVSNRANETINSVTYAGYQSGSDVPDAQDSMIQLGNVNDNTRQGAIIEFVTGANAPSYQIYQGIGADSSNIYSLNNKNQVGFGYNSATGHAYMDVFGDAYIGDRNGTTFVKYEQNNPTTHAPKVTIKAEVDIQSTFGGESLQQRVVEYAPPYDDEEIKAMIADVQKQIDGAIDTWFYDYMPVAKDQTGAPSGTTPLIWLDNAHTIPCYPYYDWYTADHGGTAQETITERAKHLSDIFYDNKTGYAFRFVNTEPDPELTPVFAWVEITDSAVIKALADAAHAQDTADHKSTIFLNNPEDQDTSKRYPTNYKKGDSWVLPSGSGEVNISNTGTERKFKKGSIITATADMVSSYNPLDWEEKVRYTDDSALTNFVNNTYSPFVTNITTQVDKKSETWYQPSNPSSAWDTDEKKASHVGDIWCDTSQNGGKKTYIWVDNGASANPRYEWKQQNVPDAVFDEIDGKADIFVSKPTAYNRNDMWIIENGIASADTPTGCQAGDIVVADNLPSGTDKRTAFVVGDWRKKDRYTDDTKYNNFITALLNGMPSGSNEVTVEAALNAIKAALNQGTTISGGLVLSSLIGLRDSNDILWAGISGLYSTSSLGNGIAAWYGGAMADMGNMTDAEKQAWDALSDAQKIASNTWAKSLFRFDGSGYFASNSIRWTADGKVYLSNVHSESGQAVDDYFFEAFAIGIDGQTRYINPTFTFSDVDIVRRSGTGYVQSGASVLNRDENDARYMVAEKFFDLFDIYDGSNNYTNTYKTSGLPSDTSNISIKAKFGLWTDSFLSALGLNPNSSGGGGGGIDMTQVWSALAASTTEQINVTHLGTALSNFSTKAETIQDIQNNGNLYLVTRANGTTFNIDAACAIDISDYFSGGYMSIGDGYIYYYNGTPLEIRKYSETTSTTITYLVFAEQRGDYNPNSHYASSFPYPYEVHVFSCIGTTMCEYVDTYSWSDASSIIKQLWGDGLYLALSGGTMGSTTLVTNLNADLLDGHHASEFLLLTGGTITGTLAVKDDVTIGGIGRLGNYGHLDVYDGISSKTVEEDFDTGDTYTVEVYIDSNAIDFTHGSTSNRLNVSRTGTNNGRLLYSNNVLAYKTEIPTSLDAVPDGIYRKLSDYMCKIYTYVLPSVSDAQLNALYIVPSASPSSSNSFDEWIVASATQVYVNGSWHDVKYKGTAMGWYPNDYPYVRDTATIDDVLLHSDLPSADAIEVCEVPYDETTGTPAVWGGYDVPIGTAYSIGNYTYVYVGTTWDDINSPTCDYRSVRKWEKVGGSGSVSKIVVGSTTYNAVGNTITLPAYLPLTGGTMSGTVRFGTAYSQKQLEISGGVLSFSNDNFATMPFEIHVNHTTNRFETGGSASGYTFAYTSDIPDLTGYATQTWVQNQGYLTSSAISDMATQTWVGQQGYVTSSALNGYATQSWVQQQGYLTSLPSHNHDGRYYINNGTIYLGDSSITPITSLSGYATQSWVQQQGYITSYTNTARMQVSDTTNKRINTQESTGNYIQFSGGTNKFTVSDGTNSFDVSITPSVTFPVTSVVGQTGAVTTAQIASALTSAGYKLTDTVYSLPLAANGTRGGVQIGYAQNGQNYPVQLSGEKMYVNVPWTDHTYDLSNYIRKGSDTLSGNWLLSYPNSDTLDGHYIGGSHIDVFNLVNEEYDDAFTVRLDIMRPQNEASSDPDFFCRVRLPQTEVEDYLNVSGSIDAGGYIDARGGFWGSGFHKDNSNDNYVLLGGGGHALISGLSVAYASSAGSATDSTKLPLSGGTLTDALIIHATTHYNDYDEGIRIQDAPNNWAGITFGATGSTGCSPQSGQVAWFGAKTPEGKFIIAPNSSSREAGLTLNSGGDALWRNNIIYHAGNLTNVSQLTNDSGYITSSGSVSYASSAGTLSGMSRNASSNWSGTGLSMLMGMSDSWGGDCLFLTNQSGQMSFCVDGCFYQRIDNTGVSRRVLDEYDRDNTTWGNADTVDGYHATSLGRIFYHTIQSNKAVRISFNVTFGAIISVRRTNGDAGLILIGNGYGENTIRNTWAQISPSSIFRWSVPATDSLSRTIEISNGEGNPAYVSVIMLNDATPTFTEIDSLYSTGQDCPIAYTTSNVASANYATSAGSCSGNASSATKLQTARAIWGQSFDGSANIDGSLEINSTGGAWNEGIRIHPSSNGWSGVVFCEASNSGSGGTSANTWSIHNNEGTFGFYKNGSNISASHYISNVGGNWLIGNGNVGIGLTSPSYKLDVNGTGHVSGKSYIGNDLLSTRTSNFHIGFETNQGGFDGTEPYLYLDYEDHVAVMSCGSSVNHQVGFDSDGWLYEYFGDVFRLYDDANDKMVIEYNSGNSYPLELNANTKVEGSLQVGRSDHRKTVTVFGSLSSAYPISDYDGYSVFVSSSSTSSYISFAKNGGGGTITFKTYTGGLELEYYVYGNGSRHHFGQNVYIDGSCDATSHPTHSDARLKNIYDYNALVSVNTIAMAPAVRFTWKDGVDKDLHCGTLAQYWQAVMPECVISNNDGYLSMQYDVIALLAAISIAKKVQNHEERIVELEKENERLRTELEQMRLNLV